MPMRLTVNSKKLGQAVVFSRPGSGYIYVDRSGDGSAPGTLGCQICDGGRLLGRTIAYSGDDDAAFARICRNWLRAYMRREFD